MLFQHIFNAISLLINHHKKCLCQLTKKIGYLSLVAFFAGNMSAIEAEDIKPPHSLLCPPGTGDHCPVEPMAKTFFTRYSHFATEPASRIFEYDPGLLPEVAEAIFALRIKHTNIGKPFVINLSGNYLLRFDKNKIDILDTYTKNIIVYRDQTANPNITIGLGVSKGLPRNYKSITIKEDAHGKLYDYAALRSDNISTDETMLTETLSHPFYQITGEDGVENEVNVTKAMAFYRTVLFHERHIRCVKSSTSIFSQLKDILWGAGTGLCEPEEAASNIHSANHSTVKEMELDQQLVEAAFQNKQKYGVGYQFKQGWDLHIKKEVTNAVAMKTSSIFCGQSFNEVIGNHRKKRDISEQIVTECSLWVGGLIYALMLLHLDFNKVSDIVLAISSGTTLAAHAYYLQFVRQNIFDANITIVKENINAHGQIAKEALQLAAGITGQAVMADPGFLANYQGIADVQDAIAHGTPAIYEVSKEAFKPLPNEVSRVDSSEKVKVVDGEQYTTHTVSSAHFDEAAKENISAYSQTLNQWKTQFEAMLGNTDADVKAKAQLYFIHNLTEAIDVYLSRIGKGKHKSGIELINTIYHNDVLIGISVGLLKEREYQTVVQLSSPQALTHKEGGYRGVLPYLESEVVKDLFSRDLIDKASIVKIIPQGAAFPAEIDLHDEL